MKYVKYTHAAALGYNPEISYELSEVVSAEGIERVKVLFEPIGFKWEEIEDKKEMISKRNR